jgi:hypothetical protein
LLSKALDYHAVYDAYLYTDKNASGRQIVAASMRESCNFRHIKDSDMQRHRRCQRRCWYTKTANLQVDRKASFVTMIEINELDLFA